MWKRWQEFRAGVEQDANALARCRVDDAVCSEAEFRLGAIVASVADIEGRAKIRLSIAPSILPSLIRATCCTTPKMTFGQAR